jgi:hypothetical protein
MQLVPIAFPDPATLSQPPLIDVNPPAARFW